MDDFCNLYRDDSEFVILFLNNGVDATVGTVAAMHADRCSVVAATYPQLEMMVAKFPKAPEKDILKVTYPVKMYKY